MPLPEPAAMPAPEASSRTRHPVADDATARRTLEGVLHALQEAFVTLDRDWCYTFVNARAEVLLGRPAHELLGRCCWTLFPDAADAVRAAHERVMATRRAETIEAHHVAWGTWYENRIHPSPDGGVATFFQEITARKHAEAEREWLLAAERDARAALASANRRLDAALLAGEVGTFEWDIAHQRVWGDANFARMFGIALDADGTAPLDRYIDVIHPDDRARMRQAVERTVTAGAYYEIEYRVLLAEGVRWLLVRARPERDAAGRVVHAQGVCLDTTAQREQAAALDAERRLLRDVFDQLPVGASLVEAPSGRVLHLNPLGARLLDYVPMADGRTTPAAGEPGAFAPPGSGGHAGPQASDYGAVFGAVHDDGTPYASDEYPTARALAGEVLHEHVMRYRRGDGTITHLAVSAAPVHDAEGRIVRAVTTWTDITERIALQDSLDDARIEAEEANRVKGEFLASMSHELRTPLNAIAGHVQLVQLGLHGDVAPAQRDALARVERAQRHLLGLINDILNYARLEAGRVEYDVREVGVPGVVRDVVPMIEPQLAARGLVLATSCPDDGDPDGAGLLVWADRDKLGQVLLNLLSNATKFTPPLRDDGTPGRIRIALEPAHDRGDHAWLHVCDTGIGIAASQLASVFEPFVQVRAAPAGTPPPEGTGLGLAISRDLARGMGGDLVAESALGAGSTFTVVLRRVVGADGRRIDRRGRETRRDGLERRSGVDRRLAARQGVMR